MIIIRKNDYHKLSIQTTKPKNLNKKLKAKNTVAGRYPPLTAGDIRWGIGCGAIEHLVSVSYQHRDMSNEQDSSLPTQPPVDWDIPDKSSTDDRDRSNPVFQQSAIRTWLRILNVSILVNSHLHIITET